MLNPPMSAPYICSSCCRLLARRAVCDARRQQLAYASFSGSNLHGTNETHPSNATQHTRQTRPSRDGIRQSRGPRMQPEEFMSYVSGSSGSSRYSRPRRDQQGPSSLEEISETSRTQRKRRPPYRSWVGELEELLKQGSLSEAWAFFNQHCTTRDCPALTHPSLTDYPKIRSKGIFVDLIFTTQKAWLGALAEGAETTPSPTVLEVLETLETLGVQLNKAHARLLWRASIALVVAESRGVDVFDHPLAAQLFHENMDIWARKIQSNIAHPAPGEEANSPWAIPTGSWAQSLRNVDSPKRFDVFFGYALPVYASTSQYRNGEPASAALLTCYLLKRGQQRENGLPAAFEKYMPFLESLQPLLENTEKTNLRSFMATNMYHVDVPPAKVDEILNSIENRAVPKHASVDGIVELHVRRLGRIQERQNLDAAEKQWVEAQAFLKPKEGEATVDSGFRPLYEHFLLTFLSLRQPQTAAEVWNSMIASGIDPTVRTWTVMMRGCQIARDVKIMESMWQRMKDSGIQPDAQAWSTRLFGLFRCNRFQDGLRALEEMGRDWLAAASRGQRAKQGQKIASSSQDLSTMGDIADVPKPNTVVLNSVISALASQGKEHIPRVLSWSRNFQIQPDVITYNALINVSLAQDRPDEAIALLQRMASAGLKPDSSTFTILLTSLLRSTFLAELSPADQQTRIMDLITSLEANGISIDQKGYALLIDRLLKEYANLPAAHAVLAHMAANNVQPTPHIYTILMTYYFDRDPPDLYAADALWNQIRARSNSGLDVIFYDRMIEGYARLGDVGRTMAFLTRMSKEGKRPGWLAMMAVVKCLADRGDEDRLREIVLDCHRKEGLLSVGLRGTKGESEFWMFVRELGVLGALGIEGV